MATDLHRAVTVRGLTRSFDGRRVLDGLDLTLHAGRFTVLLGHGGSGESTLLRVLAGLDREISGTVLVPRRRAVAVRAPRLAPWRRVWRNVLLEKPGKPVRAVAERVLEEVGLGHRAGTWPGALDEGEIQRISLARALVRDPDLLLLDDPFGALAAPARAEAQLLLAELWRRRGCTVLLATHDVDEALLLADRVLVMRDGAIAYDTAVGLDRPRSPGDPAAAALRTRLLNELGVVGSEFAGEAARPLPTPALGLVPRTVRLADRVGTRFDTDPPSSTTPARRYGKATS
ncbi:ATP-binding cassette domain-containing protein [Streptomyces zaomyceticus]|uniref:ATP-binding cassette domain-containing protein n=1 Tax=Streptomyces zaomyceticus TaxID=68286 RepID=UPI00371DC147